MDDVETAGARADPALLGRVKGLTRGVILGAVRSRALLVAIALYALAAALLTVGIGDHPPYPYNWETYTAQQFWFLWDGTVPWRNLFAVFDGVITDSGRSPIVTLPIWLWFHIFGVGLTDFRLPLALICAGTIPLLWLVGRRIVGQAAAALAAALLALSPVFLLYGRTATSVGLSMLLVVGTMGVLLRVARLGEGGDTRLWQWAAWIVALQLVLLAGIYAYAPVRLLWPLSLLVLGIELAVARGRRVTLAVALVATALVLPLALSFAYRNESGLVGKVHRYYMVRGEQIVDLQAGSYGTYLRGTPVTTTTSDTSLALRLFAQNAGDYLNLVADRHTQPTFTDFWNHNGRLQSRLLVPFLALGVGVAVWRARRREARVLLILSAGLTLPILMSSRVDVGRLAPVVPLYALLTAFGFVEVLRWLSKLAGRVVPQDVRPAHLAVARVGVAVVAVLALLAASARTAGANYYGIHLGPTPQADREHFLAEKRSLAESVGGFVLLELVAGVQALDVSGYRLGLNDAYEFLDLDLPSTATSARPDGRPKIVYGSVFNSALRASQWGSINKSRGIDLCRYVFYVDPGTQKSFAATRKSLGRACGHPVRWAALPQ